MTLQLNAFFFLVLMSIIILINVMIVYSAVLSKPNTFKKIADGIVGYYLLLMYCSAENSEIFFLCYIKKSE